MKSLTKQEWLEIAKSEGPVIVQTPNEGFCGFKDQYTSEVWLEACLIKDKREGWPIGAITVIDNEPKN